MTNRESTPSTKLEAVFKEHDQELRRLAKGLKKAQKARRK